MSRYPARTTCTINSSLSTFAFYHAGIFNHTTHHHLKSISVLVENSSGNSLYSQKTGLVIAIAVSTAVLETCPPLRIQKYSDTQSTYPKKQLRNSREKSQLFRESQWKIHVLGKQIELKRGLLEHCEAPDLSLSVIRQPTH
jgi:hypothetical protein